MDFVAVFAKRVKQKVFLESSNMSFGSCQEPKWCCFQFLSPSGRCFLSGGLYLRGLVSSVYCPISVNVLLIHLDPDIIIADTNGTVQEQHVSSQIPFPCSTFIVAPTLSVRLHIILEMKMVLPLKTNSHFLCERSEGSTLSKPDKL